jgi:hypothetical protein
MKVDQSTFPVNKLDLVNLTILIRSEQADTTKGKNMVIGDPRPENDTGLTPSCKVVMEKLPNGKETITITIRGSTMGSHERKTKGSIRLAMTESESRPPLTRSRWSDRHLADQIATVNPHR